MRDRAAILLTGLLLGAFLSAALALRLPAAQAVSVRAGQASAVQELTGGDEPAAASELLPGELLDLNTAMAEDLQRLPGIGPALSSAIIDYRAAHGSFTCREDVMLVPGIGPARYAAIEEHITVEETP